MDLSVPRDRGDFYEKCWKPPRKCTVPFGSSSFSSLSLLGFSSVKLFLFTNITVGLRYNTRLSLINRAVLCLWGLFHSIVETNQWEDLPFWQWIWFFIYFFFHWLARILREVFAWRVDIIQHVPSKFKGLFGLNRCRSRQQKQQFNTV